MSRSAPQTYILWPCLWFYTMPAQLVVVTLLCRRYRGKALVSESRSAMRADSAASLNLSAYTLVMVPLPLALRSPTGRRMCLTFVTSCRSKLSQAGPLHCSFALEPGMVASGMHISANNAAWYFILPVHRLARATMYIHCPCANRCRQDLLNGVQLPVSIMSERLSRQTAFQRAHGHRSQDNRSSAVADIAEQPCVLRSP